VFGVWVLVVGPSPQPHTPQSPIPNPQKIFKNKIKKIYLLYVLIK
jgi:hypothetical protein